MPRKKTIRSARSRKAADDSARSSNGLTTQSEKTSLTPTPLEESKTRISMEYARTIMAIGVVAFIVLLVRADIAVLTKVFLSTLLFMASVVATLLGIKR